jgi:hypothetical protein
MLVLEEVEVKERILLQQSRLSRKPAMQVAPVRWKEGQGVRPLPLRQAEGMKAMKKLFWISARDRRVSKRTYLLFQAGKYHSPQRDSVQTVFVCYCVSSYLPEPNNEKGLWCCGLNRLELRRVQPSSTRR